MPTDATGTTGTTDTNDTIDTTVSNQGASESENNNNLELVDHEKYKDNCLYWANKGQCDDGLNPNLFTMLNCAKTCSNHSISNVE